MRKTFSTLQNDVLLLESRERCSKSARLREIVQCRMSHFEARRISLPSSRWRNHKDSLTSREDRIQGQAAQTWRKCSCRGRTPHDYDVRIETFSQ